MTADGRTAVGHFTLRLNPDDPARPSTTPTSFASPTSRGSENLRPIRHRIDVIRDLPPEVQLVEPQNEEVQVAEDGRLAIKVRAEDPDFALRRVALRAVRDDRSLPIAPLLERRPPEKPWPGEFQGTYSFQPARLGLKAGDRVQYWAEAEDNKEPAANRSATDKQWITVVGPEGQRQPQANPDGAKGNPDAQRKRQSRDQRTRRTPSPTRTNSRRISNRRTSRRRTRRRNRSRASPSNPRPTSPTSRNNSRPTSSRPMASPATASNRRKIRRRKAER